MKIKTPIEFLTFNDGIVTIFETDEDDEIMMNTLTEHRFGNRVIGIKRYFAARTNDIELNKVIHIHKNLSITPAMAAVIGNTRYNIVQVQQLSETNPPVTVLSLEQQGRYEGKAYDRD